MRYLVATWLFVLAAAIFVFYVRFLRTPRDVPTELDNAASLCFSFLIATFAGLGANLVLT